MKKNERFQIPVELREYYRSQLPRGAQKQIADRIGGREASVTDFLAGRRHDWRVEEAILDYITDFQEKRYDKLQRAGLLKQAGLR